MKLAQLLSLQAGTIFCDPLCENHDNAHVSKRNSSSNLKKGERNDFANLARLDNSPKR